ncbi:MAG TPA: hypothetical protein VFH56_17070 [Acidimicrobiales bacterium]|nr:hypothetical protein [Acidimicrobiales bacterium]
MPQGGAGKGRRNYSDRGKTYTMQAAKDRFIELVQDGMNINPALDKVGRSRKTYEEWRRKDAAFAARVDQARQLRQIDHEVVRGERLGFADFRKKYLKTETFWHQQQWIDILEGREPRQLHEAQTYSPGKKSRILINCPPFHSKSVCVTIDYSVYRLCMDPSFRIILVSETSTLAEDFLFAIKTRLDHPDYIDLQKAYAPDGGWKATSEQWTTSRIVFGGDQREGGEKDPNVQAIGMGSQIYGRRADLIILDDTVTGKNVREWEKQMKWLRREVASRLEMGGKLLVIGTRIAPVDLYSQLMNPENYGNGRVPWTHFAAPAILEEGKTPDEHVTLWPYSEQPWVRSEDDECDCGTDVCREGFLKDGQRLYPRWDGLHLEIGPRADNNVTEWALVYQQKSVSEDATFPEHAVQRAVQNLRLPGLLQNDRAGHPFGGMHNKYVIASVDPSIKGYAAIIVGAVDRETKKRHIMHAWNLKAPTGQQLKDKMKEVTIHYNVDEWRIEKTGNLQFFTQENELRQWMASRGVLFREHNTGSNKWDPNFGVSSMAPLFGQYDKAWDAEGDDPWRVITEPLIELPRVSKDGVKALVHQLVTWTPELDPNKVPCDMVMALWFFEIGAREHLNSGRGTGTVTALQQRNRFIAPNRRKSLRVNLADYRGL